MAEEPTFLSNYPKAEANLVLSIPERLQALPQYTGRGVVMAFIDSGFSMHPDIAERVVAHVDASTYHVMEQPRVIKTDNLSWHGQMTSVIAAGNGSMSGGKYRGVASEAHLVLIKIATPEGFIKERDILRGLEWLIANHHIYNIRVVNISVGGDHVDYSPNHPIHLAIETLTEEGVTVLAAAGNRGEGYLLPPASAPRAITVGGYDDHNSLDHSLWTGYGNNYGTVYDERRKPEIAGPAAWLAAPILPDSQMEREARWLAPLLHKNSSDRALKQILARGYQDLKLAPIKGKVRVTDELYAELQSRIHKHKLIDEHHQHVDGTSVSVAIVASVVAQMLEANPYLTPMQIRNTLIATAIPLSGVALERQGAGVIDAVRAVNLMRLDT